MEEGDILQSSSSQYMRDDREFWLIENGDIYSITGHKVNALLKKRGQDASDTMTEQSEKSPK